jgi:hypothetical protein
MKRITLGILLTLVAGLVWYRYEHGEWYISLDISEVQDER